MSVAGSSFVPPVQLGATHALAARDHGEQKDRQKRKKPGHPEPHDEAELSAPAAEQPPVVTVPPSGPPAPGPYSAHGAARPEPEHHLDLNG